MFKTTLSILVSMTLASEHRSLQGVLAEYAEEGMTIDEALHAAEEDADSRKYQKQVEKNLAKLARFAERNDFTAENWEWADAEFGVHNWAACAGDDCSKFKFSVNFEFRRGMGRSVRHLR